MPAGYVLTRLHARYSKDGVSEDLVFKAAPAIAGGREWRGAEGKLEEGKVASPINNFQARYAIRHPWTGAIQCDAPVRGMWGGPPSGGPNTPTPALDLAFVPRGKTKLRQILAQSVPELGLSIDADAPADLPNADGADDADDARVVEPKELPKRTPRKDKKGCAVGGGAGGGGATLLLLGLAWMGGRRRRARAINHGANGVK